MRALAQATTQPDAFWRGWRLVFRQLDAVPVERGLAGQIDGGKDEMTVILRDYASNVRRMAEVLVKLEQAR